MALSSNCVCVFADGSFLAVGSHDNFIYIYSVSDGGRRYSRFGKCNVSPASREQLQQAPQEPHRGLQPSSLLTPGPGPGPRTTDNQLRGTQIHLETPQNHPKPPKTFEIQLEPPTITP